jgi:hypothetical protein
VTHQEEASHGDSEEGTGTLVDRTT